MIIKSLNKLNKKSLAMVLLLIVSIAATNFIACADSNKLGVNDFSYSDEPLLSTGPMYIETNYHTNIVAVWETNMVSNTFYIDKWFTNYVTNIVEVVTTNIVTAPEPDKSIDYYRVYVPYAGVHDGNGNNNYTNVSYKDTNGLSLLWRKMVLRYGDGVGNRPFFIRNSRNTLHPTEFKNGNDYYYFDNGQNIRHAQFTGVILKKYYGAAIVKFEHGSQKGTWTVGGVYKNYLAPDGANGYKARFQGDGPVNAAIREFMHAGDNRNDEMVELIIMNTGRRFNGDTEFGVDTYYSTKESNDWGLANNLQFINDHRAYMNNRPEYYWPYLDKKLVLKHHNHFTFIPGQKYDSTNR